jgi:hypothetical protein
MNIGNKPPNLEKRYSDNIAREDWKLQLQMIQNVSQFALGLVLSESDDLDGRFERLTLNAKQNSRRK